MPFNPVFSDHCLHDGPMVRGETRKHHRMASWPWGHAGGESYTNIGLPCQQSAASKYRLINWRQRADDSKTHCCCLKTFEPLFLFVPADCISTPTSSFHKEQGFVSLLPGNRPRPLSSWMKASHGAGRRPDKESDRATSPGAEGTGAGGGLTYWSRWGSTTLAQVGVHHSRAGGGPPQ